MIWKWIGNVFYNYFIKQSIACHCNWKYFIIHVRVIWAWYDVLLKYMYVHSYNLTSSIVKNQFLSEVKIVSYLATLLTTTIYQHEILCCISNSFGCIFHSVSSHTTSIRFIVAIQLFWIFIICLFSLLISLNSIEYMYISPQSWNVFL